MSLKRHLRGLGLSVLVLASAALTSSAQAQAVAGVARAAAPPRKGSSVRGEIGIALAQRLLASDDLATRLRGIERLGGIGTSEAIDALVDAMDQSSVPARDPHARLVAVRVLAGEARRDKVRLYLLREVTEAGGSDALRAQQPLAALVRSTAALALARSGDRKALGNLVGLAQQSQGDLWSDVALHALRAYPSASLDPFLEGRKRLTPGLAMLLGVIGDLRAIDRLRAVLVDGDQAGKVAAALALAKLGGPGGPRGGARLGQAERPAPSSRCRRPVLLTLDVPEEADAAIRGAARQRLGARRGPSPRARRAVDGARAGASEAPRDLDGDQRARVIAALGRVGAVAPLVPLLDSTETATLAAFAIATAPGREARDAIERLVAQATAPSRNDDSESGSARDGAPGRGQASPRVAGRGRARPRARRDRARPEGRLEGAVRFDRACPRWRHRPRRGRLRPGRAGGSRDRRCPPEDLHAPGEGGGGRGPATP